MSIEYTPPVSWVPVARTLGTPGRSGFGFFGSRGTAIDGAPTIYGPAYEGGVVTSSGDFGWIISGEAYPGELLSSTPNTEWKLNGAGTGVFSPSYTIPPGTAEGATVQRGLSNILTVELQDVPTIYGTSFAGATLTRDGDFGWLISGNPLPGLVLTSTPNNEWYINGVGTGQYGDTFVVPDTVVAGDIVRCGYSNELESEGEGAYAIWSTCKIRPNYEGPLVRLRKSTGGEQDFQGGGADGWVDNAAVTAWLAGGSAFVTTIYDQTGRGRNWVQPSAGEQVSFVLDASQSYLAFASGKTFAVSSDMLSMMRHTEGLTLGLYMRQPANPNAVRWPICITTGISTTAPRLGMSITSQRNARWTASANWDELTTVATALTLLDSNWFSTVVQANMREASLRCAIGATVNTGALTEASRTPNTDSLGLKLNGTTADTGGAWHLKAMVVYQKALADAQADALKAGLDDVSTLAISDLGVIQTYDNIRSKVWCFGDSMTQTTGVGPRDRWTSICGFGWDGFRQFVNRGMNGQTSIQIRDRFLATTIGPDDVVVYWAGRNNVNKAQVMADTAAVYAAMPAGKKLVIIGVCNAITESVGSTNYPIILDINASLASLYPDNYLNLRSAWVAAYNPAIAQDVIDFGRDTPPASQMLDGLHANEIGNAVHAGIINPFIVSKGW